MNAQLSAVSGDICPSGTPLRVPDMDIPRCSMELSMVAAGRAKSRMAASAVREPSAIPMRYVHLLEGKRLRK